VGEKPKFKRVQITDFRCIRQMSLQLTPLHALIGPNDSGKSTILRAIAAHPYVVREPSTTLIVEGLKLSPGHLQVNPRRPVLRLDPDALRRATKLLPSSQREIWFTDERGGGLASLYDALLGRDRRSFTRLEDQFKMLFPTVESLRLENVTDDTKALGVTLIDGTSVNAAGMSEGMLYWLAFAIISHLAPVEMVLVEEPENGLHPSRIAEVVRIFYKISASTQVVLSTHSPLVINELQAHEVTIVTRNPEKGTVCTPMMQTKNFKERSEVYALGELWLSYADGDFEKELVGDGTEAAKE
jgi:predicted ATPase